ncbi:MAG: BLUF domain-containing protein [Gillisia sp.]
MHYAIAYVSTATDLERSEVENILEKSEKNNNKNDLTGILLFSEGNFFQIIEGEKEKILELYQKIKDDERHHNLIQIFGKDIHKESYDGYEAAFVSEGACFDSEKFHEYLKHLQVLDKPSQLAVKNMLKAFVIQ